MWIYGLLGALVPFVIFFAWYYFNYYVRPPHFQATKHLEKVAIVFPFEIGDILYIQYAKDFKAVYCASVVNMEAVNTFSNHAQDEYRYTIYLSNGNQFSIKPTSYNDYVYESEEKTFRIWDRAVITHNDADWISTDLVSTKVLRCTSKEMYQALTTSNR